MPNTRALPVVFGPLRRHPKLLAALAIGLVLAVALALSGLVRPSTAAILGWDATCLVYICGGLHGMRGRGPRDIQARSAEEDAGGAFILGLVIIGAAASLGAIGIELATGEAASAVERAVKLLLTVATVAGSWTVIHLAFALHYAHAFYAQVSGKPAAGLKFPGDNAPDYWDFLHFSLVIGVACQTADVAFTSKGLRRLGSVHGVVAFAFNTVILALSINMLAGLFQSK